MSTTNPGLPIKPPFGGQLADKDCFDIPDGYATLLLNWLKRGGKFQVRPGYTAIGSPLAERGTGIIQYDHHLGHRFVVIGTLTKWWWWDLENQAWANITDAVHPLTGTEITRQIFRVFYKSNKSYLLGVNGHTDTPKKWDGVTATYEEMGGSPPKSKCMAINNGRLLLGNTYTTQANPHQVDVSSFNDFETGWAATQTVNLLDTPGEIVEMREFGNLATAIYKTDALYIASAQADLAPFSFELRAASIIGPVSPACVVSLPSCHIFMGRGGGFWKFDGVQVTPLPDYLRQHVYNTADLGALNRSIGWHDGFNNEVWFIYRGRGSADPNLGIVINMSDLTAWPVSFTNFRPSAAMGTEFEENIRIGDMVLPLSSYTDPLSDLRHVYLRPILVGHAGLVTEEEGNYTDNGDPVPFDMELGTRAPADLKTLFTASEVDSLFARAAASQLVSIQLGKSDDGNDTVYDAAQTVNIGAAGPYSVGSRLTSRLFSLRISGNATQKVQWRGSIISGAARGLR